MPVLKVKSVTLTFIESILDQNESAGILSAHLVPAGEILKFLSWLIIAKKLVDNCKQLPLFINKPA